jgi:hypothetical protein
MNNDTNSTSTGVGESPRARGMRFQGRRNRLVAVEIAVQETLDRFVEGWTR